LEGIRQRPEGSDPQDDREGVIPPAVGQYLWHSKVLPWAVNALVNELCFGGPAWQNHAECKKFWDALPEDQRYYRFYCLSEPNVCVNCGETWFGLSVDVETGELAGNVCPQCHEPYVGRVMQQHDWWVALATKVAAGIDTMDRTVRGLVGDMTYRLAEFIDRAKLIVYQPGDLRGRASAIRDYLRLAGLNTSYVIDAANYVAFKDAAADVVAPLLDAAQVTTEDLNVGEKRVMASLFLQSMRSKIASDRPLPTPDAIRDKIGDDSTATRSERLRVIRNEVAGKIERSLPGFVIMTHPADENKFWLVSAVPFSGIDLAILEGKGFEWTDNMAMSDVLRGILLAHLRGTEDQTVILEQS
jgi:hypothetical protein